MKKIIFLMLFFTTPVLAEDLMGYVLRHNYWGVNYYWVHDSSRWGLPTEPPEEENAVCANYLPKP